MAADNIREIFRTDTVGEFMDKCNWNFGIISRIGGPRGLQGERGETGARGRRGAMLHTVNEPDEMMDYMDVETASEILSTLDVGETENMEDGDVVFFKNGWVCEIGIEDGEIVAREPVFPIIGPQGPQGERGESTDSLFSINSTDISGNALLLNHISLTVGNRIYLPTMDNFNGGLYFTSMTDSGNNNITIGDEKAFINFNQNTLNINSNSGINIGTSSNSQINFSINNGDIMKVENDGLKLYKKVEFMGSTNIPGEIVKGGNKISLYNYKTTFNKEIIVSDGNNATGIGPDAIQTQTIAISDTGNVNAATNFNLITSAGILLFTPQTISSIGNTSGYFSIMANGGSSRIKMMSASTTFEKPIIIPGSSSLKFTNRSYTTNNTNETNTGNFGQMDFSTDAINILYNTNSATTPITNRIIVKNDRTTFYKPIEISVISANQPTVTPGVPNDYQKRTAKIEYKYNQSDGSYLNIDKPVKAVVDGESVFLGVPAYTIIPYPSASDTPTGWELFDDNILMTVDNNSSTYAFRVLYNSRMYNIPAVSGLNDENFASLVSSEEKTLGVGTPKLTNDVKNSTSELLELSGTIALQNVSEQSPYAFIATLGEFEDKGNGKETKPEFRKYENLMKKISANDKDMKDIFTSITDSDDTILAFAYPKPKAPTGFTYIFKTE